MRHIILPVFLLTTACAEGLKVPEETQQRLAPLPKEQHYRMIQTGWLLESKCMLLSPGDHEQLFVDAANVRKELDNKHAETLDAQAKSQSAALACESAGTREAVTDGMMAGRFRRMAK